jgi:hypothetical protein
VKVTGTVKVRMFSADYIENFSSQYFIFHLLIGRNNKMSPINVGVNRSKIQVTWALYVRIVSADYLENYSSQNLHVSHTD